MFPFTKAGLENFIAQAVYITAKKLGVNDSDMKSQAELYEEISKLDPVALDKLENFITEYRAWYELNFDETGNGIKDIKDPTKAQITMTNRDKTRAALLKHLESISKGAFS
jgi:hypothetical protein